MTPERAVEVLKNEHRSLGNHGEAVQVLRENRIVVASIARTGEFSGLDPLWRVDELDFQDDDDFQEMALYRRARPEGRAGLYWASNPSVAWCHVGPSFGEKKTYSALVPPSALLAVITYRKIAVEYIVDTTGLDIRSTS